MIARALMAAAVLATAVPAAAQDETRYRSGLPEVLAPARPAADAVGTSFATAYRGRGRPRIIVFWMRPLSDRTESERRTVEQLDETIVVGSVAAGRAMVRSGWAGGTVDSHAAGATVAQRSLRRTETTGFIPEPSRDPLAPEASRAAESAFLRAFTQAGARVMDRTAAIHLSAEGTDAPHAAEAAALKTKADLLVEVTAASDGQTAGRLLYRVDARALPGGAVVASFVTDADPRPGTESVFSTAPGRGYIELPGAALGQELAWQAMERIVEAWRR